MIVSMEIILDVYKRQLKTTLGRIFKKKEASDGSMTPFQAVCTALAGTVGTGNIAGVAGADEIGQKIMDVVYSLAK